MSPRMKSRYAALMMLFVLQAANADAANWVRVVNNGTSRIFVDTDSIRRTGDIVAAWYRRDFSRPMVSGKKGQLYKSSKVLNYYNCADHELATAQWITYENTGGAGRIISNEKVVSLAYGDVSADEAGEKIFGFVCNYVKPRKK